MSIVLMSAAFKAQIKATQKLVLLALCDCANDQGECYPSVPTLMEKCSAAERTVQESIGFLEREGFLSREFRTGRSTVYWITDPRTWRTPAADAPPQQAHPTPAPGAPRINRTPAPTAPPPPQQAHPTPAPGAPITIIEPSVEPSKKRKAAPQSVAVSVLIEAGFTEKQASEFIDHKTLQKAPLTERAWKDHLRESAKAGWSASDAAEKVMAKNWKGFEAKYVADVARPAFATQPAMTVPPDPAAEAAAAAKKASEAAHAAKVASQTPEQRAAVQARLAIARQVASGIVTAQGVTA